MLNALNRWQKPRIYSLTTANTLKHAITPNLLYRLYLARYRHQVYAGIASLAHEIWVGAPLPVTIVVLVMVIAYRL